MSTILFYTANGVGLGHLRRTQLITEELKDEVLLATSSSSPQKLGKFFSHLIKLNPLTEELIINESKYLRNREENKKKLLNAIKKFKPDILISDIYLSAYSFYPLESISNNFHGKKIFIWRLSFNKPFLELRKNSYKLSFFDKIIIPHSKDEVDFHSLSFLKKIESIKSFEIVGPIFKRINRKILPILKNKYKILPNNFVLTITFGAGGGNQKKCQSPDKILESFLSIYPELAKNIPNLKVVISTGPYFKKARNFPAIKITKFENNLSELFHLSDLVISTAGYNTCNELIETKSPSILIPLERGNDEQFKRAEYLENKNICRVVRSVSSQNLLKVILESKNDLAQMKESFSSFSSMDCGNKKVAKIISNLL